MAYADYAFYTDTYGGGAIPSAAFPGMEARAAAYVDTATFGRLPSPLSEDIAAKVGLAVCSVADLCYWETGVAGKTDETTAGHTESYESRAELEARKYAALKLYLGNTGLLYRGL